MNRGERQLLLSERTTLEGFLTEIPVEDVLDRGSVEGRLRKVNALLAQCPDDTRQPARARLTFRGKPVVDSYGIFADFGARATQAFSDTVAKVAASLEGPLASMGPVPNKAQNQLLITSTALGSFGFELEEHREGPMLIDDGSAVADAVAATQTLLKATTGDDDSLADAAAGMEPRAITAARSFLQLLADNEAVCALEFGDQRFSFSSVAEVRRSADRLAQGNLHEEQAQLQGEFQGVLPKSRTFEFKLSGSNEVIKGKVGPGITDPDALNRLLHNPMTITVAATRVGDGRPRFVLNTQPAEGSGTT